MAGGTGSELSGRMGGPAVVSGWCEVSRRVPPCEARQHLLWLQDLRPPFLSWRGEESLDMGVELGEIGPVLPRAGHLATAPARGTQ
jgi:hypothetical protein